MKKLLIISLLLSVSTGFGTDYGTSMSIPMGRTVNTTEKTTTHKAVVKAAQEHAVNTLADAFKQHGKQIKVIGQNITDSAKIIQQNTGITTDEVKKAAAHLYDTAKNTAPKIATILSPSPLIAPYINNIHSNLQFAIQHLAYPVQQVQNALMPLLLVAQQEIMSEQDYNKQIAITLRHFGELALMLSQELKKNSEKKEIK